MEQRGNAALPIREAELLLRRSSTASSAEFAAPVSGRPDAVETAKWIRPSGMME